MLACKARQQQYSMNEICNRNVKPRELESIKHESCYNIWLKIPILIAYGFQLVTMKFENNLSF